MYLLETNAKVIVVISISVPGFSTHIICPEGNTDKIHAQYWLVEEIFLEGEPL